VTVNNAAQRVMIRLPIAIQEPTTTEPASGGIE
jgi:hypothetical protein